MAYTPNEILKNWLDSGFKFYINREEAIKGMTKFLTEMGRMKDEYLGACLDYVRWGGSNTVMYEMGTLGLIDFIKHWMNLNKNNLIWSDENPSSRFTLPYIKHDKCPADGEHEERLMDLGGRIRCVHRSWKRFKPSFVESYDHLDENSQSIKIEYLDRPKKPSSR